MAFMKPVAEHFAAYIVDTDHGVEIVPESVCGTIKIEDNEPCDNGLEAYIEVSHIFDVERRQGWFARLSADGYLDCTSWNGPHETKALALAAVKEMYEVDNNGELEKEFPESAERGTS